VLTIILRGYFAALAAISFNKGRRDVRRLAGVVRALFGADAAPAVTHPLSLISFTTCCGALMLVPFAVGILDRRDLQVDTLTLADAGLHADLSLDARVVFNRGWALIGPNRAAPFFHLVPVFGSALAILLLGAAQAIIRSLRAGAGRRRDRVARARRGEFRVPGRGAAAALLRRAGPCCA